MKRDLTIIYHLLRLNRYRKKAFNMLSNSGYYHDAYLQINRDYREVVSRYRHSMNLLARMGVYKTAVSLIPQRKASNHEAAC